MDLQILDSNIWCIICSKLEPNDLINFRLTCHEIKTYMDDKVIPKLFLKLQTVYSMLLSDIDKALIECKAKEDAIDQEVKKELEELKNKDIENGDYDPETDGEYLLYDDDDDGNEIFDPIGYLKGKRNLKYPISLLGHKFIYGIDVINKLHTKLLSATASSSTLNNPSSTKTEKSFTKTPTKTHLMRSFPSHCEMCKAEYMIGGYLEFSSHVQNYYFCHYCVINDFENFIIKLCSPSAAESLHAMALSYNFLRILSGSAGLSYSN